MRAANRAGSGSWHRLLNVALLATISAAMFALLFVVYKTIETERATRDQATRTSLVLIELRNVGHAALNAETGQRGYLITLDRRYLDPYQVGSEQIGPALARLRALLGDSATPRQIELYDQIDTLSRAKFAEMKESVQLVQEGRRRDAERAILTDEGVESMRRLRRALREMEQIESRFLSDAAARTSVYESRVLPLLGALIVLLMLAIIAGSRLAGRAARAEAEASQAAALAEAHDRADLLARELNHRVKNLFSVVLAIVQMSARNKPEAKPVAESIAQRIRALLTAHEVTQGELEKPVASLATLVETTLAPYRSETQQATLAGPEILLPAKRVTPLGLVLHELTTNAVKYGAWSRGGAIFVTWERRGDRVIIIWRETGGSTVAPGSEPERKGFGSLLMNSASRQFGGTVERNFTPDGLVVTLDLPADE